MKHLAGYRVFLGGIVALPILSVVISFLWVFLHIDSSASRRNIDIISPQGHKINIAVEIADEPEELEQGLMFRQHLENGTGMLFIFNEPKTLEFWMKNTLIPLDIFYFDDMGLFVSKTTMVPCKTEVCPTYPSTGFARYALEVNRGEERIIEVGEGWKLMLHTGEN